MLRPTFVAVITKINIIMKKVFLIAVLGLFIFASASTFANSVNDISVTPVVQTDDDPEEKKSEESDEKESCDKSEKKCDKSCEKKCCKKEKSSCSKK